MRIDPKTQQARRWGAEQHIINRSRAKWLGFHQRRLKDPKVPSDTSRNESWLPDFETCFIVCANLEHMKGKFLGQ